MTVRTVGGETHTHNRNNNNNNINHSTSTQRTTASLYPHITNNSDSHIHTLTSNNYNQRRIPSPRGPYTSTFLRSLHLGSDRRMYEEGSNCRACELGLDHHPVADPTMRWRVDKFHEGRDRVGRMV